MWEHIYLKEKTMGKKNKSGEKSSLVSKKCLRIGRIKWIYFISQIALEED
jgi:hypothetical protein